ncbi:MAG: hypothetical protein NVV74_21400 [Magnetospirillum sp.]|nr:hypothetical protein [Magnetospirillum sp.]
MTAVVGVQGVRLVRWATDADSSFPHGGHAHARTASDERALAQTLAALRSVLDEVLAVRKAPLTMTAAQAAAYLGMEERHFLAAVARRELPKALLRSRPARWSRTQLDLALDGRQQTDVETSDTDPVMERINAFQAALRR